MTRDRIIAGYASAAEALIAPYESAVSTEALLAPVIDLLPDGPGRMLDLGAGTGRDAAWGAARGLRPVAIEPVAAFREAGQRLHTPEIDWRADRLPELASLRDGDGPFDLILANGVWHHLDQAARGAVLQRLAGLAAPGGRLVLSLRHGPTPEGRPGFVMATETVLTQARDAGFALLRHRDAPSHQSGNRARGVTWSWLALQSER